MRMPDAARTLLLRSEWEHPSHFAQHLCGTRVGARLGLDPPSGPESVRNPTGLRLFREAWEQIEAQLGRAQAPAIEFETRKFRTLGEQRIPVRLQIPDLETLARFLGPSAVERLARVRERLDAQPVHPRSLDLALRHYVQRIEPMSLRDSSMLHSTLSQLRAGLGVGVPLQSLPLVDVDTKFVERNLRTLSLILDRSLCGQVTVAGGLLAWLGCQVPWQVRWNVVRKLSSGGQAFAYVVTRKAAPTGGSFFLKVFNGVGSERRTRMFREVACYRTLSHRGIPKLIESNAAEYKNQATQLYLVTELIAGRDLGQHVGNRPLETTDALNIFGQLLDIVEYAHAKEVIHRDIKPENVMVESSAPLKIRLVDFGMSFLGAEHDDDHSTVLGQEIGNRFLRLPEHGVGSANKRDARSDLTQCVGLLFFALTGLRPRFFEDEHGLRPHQRATARERLIRHVELDLLGLLNVFDRAFENKIDARWQTAEELRHELSKIQTTAR